MTTLTFYYVSETFVRPLRSFIICISVGYWVIKIKIYTWVFFTFVLRCDFEQVFTSTVVTSIIGFSLLVGL